MKKILFLFILATMSVKAQYTPGVGLVAIYPFDGDANDYSGNSNNGTVYGATLTTDRFNVANRAYSFDGINDYILVPSSASYNSIETSTAVSITAWVNIRAWYQNWSHFMILERHKAATDNGWGFAILKQPAQVSIFYPQDMAMADTIGFQPLFNNWYHVAVTWNKNGEDSVRMYINGVKKKTFKTNTPLTNTNNGMVYIGTSIVGIDEYSDGKIDELGVYNRVLTDTEIYDIYQGCQTPVLSALVNQTVSIGGTAQFVAVSSNTTVSYQWQINTGQGFSNLTNGGQFSGVTTSVLAVANVTNQNNTSLFRCTISGCGTKTTSVSMLTVKGATGIDELSTDDVFSVRPNPATDLMSIDVGIGTIGSPYVISDAAGKIVLEGKLQEQETILNLSHLEEGLYTISIKGLNTKKVLKLNKK